MVTKIPKDLLIEKGIHPIFEKVNFLDSNYRGYLSEYIFTSFNVVYVTVVSFIRDLNLHLYYYNDSGFSPS